MRTGDVVSLVSDFRVIGFDLDLGFVKCQLYGDNLLEFVLPAATPVFGLGPPPYYTFLHPTHLSPSHPNFCTYLNQERNEVYCPKLQVKGTLALEANFYLDGKFRLVHATGKDRVAEYLESIRSSPDHPGSFLEKLVTQKTLIPGAACIGRIDGFIMISTVQDDYAFRMERLEKSKLVEKGKLLVKVKVSFSKYSEAYMAPELLTVKNDNYLSKSNYQGWESALL